MFVEEINQEIKIYQIFKEMEQNLIPGVMIEQSIKY